MEERREFFFALDPNDFKALPGDAVVGEKIAT